MNRDEGLITKLWLEERESDVLALSSSAPFKCYKFTLNKVQAALVKACINKKTIKINDLYLSAWGILLNRLSTTDSVIIGVGCADIKSKSALLHQPIKTVVSHINESLKIKAYLKAIQQQIKAKSKADNINEVRYLFLTKKVRKSKLSTALDTQKFTLALYFDAKNPSKLCFTYNPRVFQENNIQRIADYYLNILTTLCEQPNINVIDIEIMSAKEKKQILSNWSKPSYSFEKPIVPLCTHAMIAKVALDFPNLLAISHHGDQMTFGMLNEAADKLAKFFTQKGIEPQNNIAVLMERTPSLIITMLALFKIGAIFVPINPKYPLDRTEFVIKDSEAKFVIANDFSKLPEIFINENKTIILSQDWQELPAPTSDTLIPASSFDYIAYIIYTSGTTGNPKGVMINHGNLTDLALWYETSYAMTSNDRSSQFASQGFDTYICETIPVLACGTSVHIVDDNVKLTPDAFFTWLKSEKITLCDLPTAYAQMLLSMDWPENLNLRMMKIGGETCTRYPSKAYEFDIWNVYGPTETTIESTYYKMHTAHQVTPKSQQYATPSIGKIHAGGEVYIVDKYLKPVPAGVAGELLIGGTRVSPGYFHREELTAQRFIKNDFNVASTHHLYRTGDLAAWLPDGNITFIGRIDNQVKIRGYRIELGDVENIISKFPDVREVAVLAKEALNGEKSIIAYVVPNLDRERYLIQERCLLSIDNNQFIETITEDISKYGIALSGVNETIPTGKRVKLHLKLPGFNTGKDIHARLIWQIDARAGFVFDLNNDEQAIIHKCIDYFISSHNIMDLVLSASAKRSLRKALAKKLPEYMVPSSFVTMIEFPLTFSGKIDLKALPPPDDYENILRKQFVAPHSESERKVTAIWEKILSRKHIGMEDNFFDLGGNSLKAAELSVRIMEVFNISLPAKILFDLPYIPILSQYIDTRGEQYATQSYLQDEIERDVILPENIMPTGITSKRLHDPENILLTGAGGFLGVFMLNEILKSTNAKIHCLVRQGEFESAASKLTATIKKFGLEGQISLANRRIIAIPSDISLEHFGISEQYYEALAKKVDIIYHCGAQVNIMASYNKLRGSNVQGTLEIIKFASHQKDKPIHYISTLSSAYLMDENGALTEEFPNNNHDDLFGGYAISKWVSERLLTELKDRGLPIVIYRSGYISGDSITGITSLNDALLMLIKGCIALGFAPDMKEKITILPADFVSRAIVKISLASGQHADIYHIDHPVGIMWVDLVNWLNDYGYSIKMISLREWKIKLRGINQDNALYPFLPYYLSLPDDYHSPNVRTEKASAALHRAGLEYPEINDKLLNIYFDYLCNEGFFETPVKKTIT